MWTFFQRPHVHFSFMNTTKLMLFGGFCKLFNHFSAIGEPARGDVDAVQPAFCRCL